MAATVSSGRASKLAEAVVLMVVTSGLCTRQPKSFLVSRWEKTEGISTAKSGLELRDCLPYLIPSGTVLYNAWPYGARDNHDGT